MANGRHLRRATCPPLRAVLLLAGAWIGAGFPAAASAANEFEKVGTVGVQFLKIPVGARATAMGSAFTAVADDASCVYWNVGGLARIGEQALAVTHAPLLADVSFTQVTYIGHTRYLPGTYAVHMRGLTMPEMDVRTVFRPEGDGTRFDAGDLALGISYGRSLTDKFSAGIGGNFIQSTLAAYRASAVTFDFGTMYDTGYRNLRIGMEIQNIGGDITYMDEPVKVPTVFRVGMSSVLLERAGQRVVVAGEFSHPADNAERANAGMEYALRSLVFLRAGWYYRFDSERFSTGGGVRMPEILGHESRFDYAYTELRDLPAQHRVSAEFYF